MSATSASPRLPFALDPLMAEAKRRMRKRRLLILLLAVVIGGGAAGTTVALNLSSSVPAAVGLGCGRGASGQGFHVFACMSGGARAGHPHPKELLVVRNDGSSVAYPAFRVGDFAVGDGEVVATRNVNLVRVTSSRLVPLLTPGELARALHIHSAAIADIYPTRVDAAGDIYFTASMLSRSGCQNRTLERTAGGTIRQIRASSTSRHNTCG